MEKLIGWTKEKVLENKISALEREKKELIEENHQLGLDAQVLTHQNVELTSQCESLKRSESMALTDLRKAKAVAEYWKIRAEASEKLMQVLNS